MSDMLTVRVCQVRETEVVANSLEDAILIASLEFSDSDWSRKDDGSLDKPWGHVTQKAKQTHIHADLV